MWPRSMMDKQDYSWRRLCVVRCVVLVLVVSDCGSGKQMSETLQRALSAVRGPSPGAKKLLNIPEDGADPLPGKHVPLESYESELEREHALPTSVPNADILKTNSNPTYHKPRPPQHHGAALLAGVGSGAVPSYAPPGRAFFTPPLPPEYRNPFADKPTLRGTNTDGNNYLNRRPIPPPSLGPGHDRIPIRPPGQETSSPQVPAPPPAPPAPPPGLEPQKKKPLNTPSHKPDELDGDIKHGTDQANFTDFVPNSLNIPTISRILSGSNGRKEDIPDVLLRTVTAKPQHQPEKTSKSDVFVTKDTSVTLSDSNRDSSTEGSVLAVLDPEMNIDRPLIIDQNGETNTRRNLQYSTNKDRNDSRNNENYMPATTIGFELKDPEMSTERYHNLANVNSDKKVLKQDPKNNGPVQRPGATWPFAWNVHIYLATVMFTILAVYSIFKIICYNKFTHLFTQYYFIILHLILVFVCLMRIFYLCYDPYNINNSLPIFISEILLHVPEIFLTIAFASTILFLMTNSANYRNKCCSFLFRSRTIIVGGGLLLLTCVTLHIFENSNTIYRTPQGVEKRVLGLTCQIIFIIVCLILGLCYLYVYKMLKAILQKKSHNYIHGFQNLYQGIHINLATALLFVLMATLQIYGIIGINQVSMTKFDWLQWGYQFSLRLIEISVVALISWVISLKIGIVASLQHEKGDGQKISGFFPCTAGSSNEQFESDYPTICSTNTNLKTYTLRTGKPVYETAGHHPVMPEQCFGANVMEHQRFQLSTLAGNCDNNSGTENYSGHSSIANAGHSSSTESSNAASGQGVTNHLIKHHPNMAGYNGIESASDDHYSNCDPAIQSLQGDDPLDHEYNVIQYGSNSDFIRDIKNQNYNGGSNRSSHNFKHMSYDRVSSRTNSNPRKKHRAKNKNVQNCMTMGYDPSMNHHYHQPHMPDEYSNYNAENASYHSSGIQTLNPNRSYEAPCQQIRSSQRRNSPSTVMVNSSGSQKRGKGNGFPDRPKSTDLYGFSEDPNDRAYPCALGTPQPAPRNCSYEASYSQPQDEINPNEGGGSMLVAQDGFVRFRPLEDGPSQT
ncbi:uncharacterized protein LOC106716885 isoform X1 [Papilio machaon]|uniref:uncharacterized protein LOC106716885 isoform X1 n=1 Tax=Papilio machaon TaxID=76193 RepID=UPI0006EAE74B|nr:uncharacterized protein LOC106716885 isoform X1 [Papilio machaon]